MKGRIGWQGLKANEFIDEGPYLVTGTDFYNGSVNWNTCYHISEERYNEAPEIHVQNGDILITKDGTIGKLAYIKNKPEKVSLNSHLLILRPLSKDIENRYIYFALQSPAFEHYTGLVQSGTTMSSLSQEKIGNYKLALPSLLEQLHIAIFLDEKCKDIDTLITLQEEMIAELQAYKQSVISEAVTKGLNPNVPMKDSGVKWIGEIPSEWNACKTLYILSMPITDGPHTTPTLYKTGVPFVSAEAVSTGKGKINFDRIRGYISEEFYQECCKKYIPQINDIFMIKSGATTGRVSIVDTDKKFTIWSPLAVFRCNTLVMKPQYLFYALQSNGYQKQIELGWSFGTQQNIGMRTLEQLVLTVPPLSEQQAIADYLDTKCAQIDELIALKQQKITELQDYKKSLIYEYVTGKKEVPANN